VTIRLGAALILFFGAISAGAQAQSSACGQSAIEHELEIRPPNEAATPHLALGDALDILNIASVSLALIQDNELKLVCAYGKDVSTRSLYQAASLSKLITAVAALRLVQEGRLDLDSDVDAALLSWHIPKSALTGGHPVTLRGLLSMTGGIGVPGYSGYEPGDPLPNLVQILDGLPPAHSPPVRVEYRPGSRYLYSGGGYEIVQALVQDTTHRSFAEALQTLVLGPAGMADSLFAQTLPPNLIAIAAMGHHGDGDALPGGWRVTPELAADGLWSTPSDLAHLLIDIAQAYRGETGRLLDPATAKSMFTRQNGGPYGLGGAVSGSGRSLVLMKRGQNVGYQAYLLIFPESGQGMVVMTDSDNGTTLAETLIRRAAVVYRWPSLGEMAD
jgi:CubicO group peptidase (beta-lactamase class C family)